MTELFNDENPPDRFYAKKKIQSLQGQETHVQLVGYVRNLDVNDEFHLEDLSGKIHIRDIPEDAPAIKEGKLFRIFGRYEIDGSATPYIAAEIVQDVENLDINLYFKALDHIQTIG